MPDESATPSGLDLTVIVYVHDAEGQIRSCLESVLSALPAAAEVIVIDDGSPDGSRRIIAEIAAGDPRVRPVAHALPVGQAEALRLALAEARGEWVAFVDGRDLVETDHFRDSIETGARLDADMVVTGVVEVSATGQTPDAPVGSSRDTASSPRTVTLADKPRLAGSHVGLRGRLYRLRLLADPRFGFGADPRAADHGAAVAIVLADRIAVLAEIGCRWRHRFLTGRPTPLTEALLHIAAAEELDRRMIELGADPKVRRRVAAVSTADLRTVHDSLVSEDRPAVALAITEHLNSPVTPDHAVLLSREDQAFHELLRRGAPLMYKITARADSAWTYAKEQRRKLRSRLQETRVNQRRRIGFGAALQQPIDDHIAVFSSDQGNTATGSPLAVFETLLRRAPHMRCVWLLTSRADPDGLPDDAWVRRGTWEYYDLIGRARYFVSDGSFPAFVTKRPGTIEVHTPEMAPFLKVGVDSSGSAKEIGAEFGCARRWDYVLSSCASTSENLLGAFPADFRVLEIGQPANDLLYRHSDLDRARVCRGLGVDRGDLVVFHASAWGRVATRPMVEGLSKYSQLTERACHIISLDAERVPESAPGVNVIVADGSHDLRELMIVSDLMITDASPLMFDFCNLGRPIVNFIPDRSVAAAAACYVDIRADHAGLLVVDGGHLTDLLGRGGWTDPHVADAVVAFKHRFATFEDGSASERLIELVFYDALARAS